MAEGDRVVVGYRATRRKNLRVVVELYGIRAVCSECEREFTMAEKKWNSKLRICGDCRWASGVGADE